ncbi:hypothetical protein F6Y02_36715 (plasmid) [Bacillus megaterium]|nr:hypothetical protein [Priestia megaterium]
MSSASAEAQENEDSNPYLEESSINVEENQPELSEFSDHESLPEEYKMDYSRESNPCDGICTQAAGTGLGAKTSDTAKSSIIKGGTNKIYGEVYSTGRAQDFSIQHLRDMEKRHIVVLKRLVVLKLQLK